MIRTGFKGNSTHNAADMVVKHLFDAKIDKHRRGAYKEMVEEAETRRWLSHGGMTGAASVGDMCWNDHSLSGIRDKRSCVCGSGL